MVFKWRYFMEYKRAGIPGKNFSTKELLRKYKADIVMFQNWRSERSTNHVPAPFWGVEIKIGSHLLQRSLLVAWLLRGNLICLILELLNMEVSRFLSMYPFESPVTLGGYLVSMYLLRVLEMRIFGSTILDIWLMELGVLVGILMRTSIQKIITGVLVPLSRCLTFILQSPNLP